MTDKRGAAAHHGAFVPRRRLPCPSIAICALVFPTVPRVALAATPESSSLENFGLLIQNTDPGSNAGIPGLQLPAGLGAASGLPVGLELDGPAGSDRRLLAVGLAVEGVLGRLPAPTK